MTTNGLVLTYAAQLSGALFQLLCDIENREKQEIYCTTLLYDSTQKFPGASPRLIERLEIVDELVKKCILEPYSELLSARHKVNLEMVDFLEQTGYQVKFFGYGNSPLAKEFFNYSFFDTKYHKLEIHRAETVPV